MAFRVNESAITRLESAKNYFAPRDFDSKTRDLAEKKIIEIANRYGPVVDHYPSWHPLVAHHDERHPQITPDEMCGYQGLDHTAYFLNAFITCPYGEVKNVIDSVQSLPINNPVKPMPVNSVALPINSFLATIRVEKLDVQLYAPDATPILVSCEWGSIPNNEMIPTSIALPLMLQEEIPCCRWGERAETWESMRPYFLGSPHGSRSSLFVNQETGMTMKKVWNLLINSGMFGPVK